jgi:hypothetical protein
LIAIGALVLIIAIVCIIKKCKKTEKENYVGEEKRLITAEYNQGLNTVGSSYA